MSYKFSTQTERTNQSLHDELIAKAEEKQETIDPDDIFRKIKDG